MLCISEKKNQVLDHSISLLNSSLSSESDERLNPLMFVKCFESLKCKVL